MCQTPHQAAMKAIPPISRCTGKIFGLKMSTKANPEFWMPVSIVIERLSGRERPIIEAALYPVNSAMAL